jgi:hypothetical protein
MIARHKTKVLYDTINGFLISRSPLQDQLLLLHYITPCIYDSDH